MAAKEQHFPAKAKSVIWLFMNGGPSQVDTWDYKPELEKHDGQELEGFDKNTGFFTGNVGRIMKSPFQFSQHGESGSWVSEIFPNIARHVDKMAFLHSCYTEVQQPQSRFVYDQHGHEAYGISQCRLLGNLWAGNGKPKPAVIRHHV